MGNPTMEAYRQICKTYTNSKAIHCKLYQQFATKYLLKLGM